MFKSLRIQLIFTIFICLLTAFAVFKMADFSLNKPKLNFEEDIRRMDSLAKRIAGDLNENKITFDRPIEFPGQSIAIVDSDGKVVSKTMSFHPSSVDIPDLIQKMSDEKSGEFHQPGREHTSIYPVKNDNFSGYAVISGMPKGRMLVERTFPAYPFLIASVVFVALFFVLTRRKIKEIEQLSKGLHKIAKGEFAHRISTRSCDEIGNLANDINAMAYTLQNKIQQMEAIEQTKNELIVNVSHDLRTPLTSVMGYLQLLIDQSKGLTTEQEKYLNISFEKSKKLKTLIDRLFEYTKLASQSVKLERQYVSFNELLEQVVEEFGVILEEKGVSIDIEITKEKLVIAADPDQFVRVLDNLMVNAAHYAIKEEPIKITLYRDNNDAIFAISNSYVPSATGDISRIFERFYRLDPSRASSSGNSGLGLAISKTIMDLHDGKIEVETKENKITFKIKMPLDKQKNDL